MRRICQPPESSFSGVWMLILVNPRQQSTFCARASRSTRRRWHHSTLVSDIGQRFCIGTHFTSSRPACSSAISCEACISSAWHFSESSGGSLLSILCPLSERQHSFCLRFSTCTSPWFFQLVSRTPTALYALETLWNHSWGLHFSATQQAFAACDSSLIAGKLVFGPILRPRS